MLLDPDKAIQCYENALRHNPYNPKALTQIASLCRIREQFPKVCLLIPSCQAPKATNQTTHKGLTHLPLPRFLVLFLGCGVFPEEPDAGWN